MKVFIIEEANRLLPELRQWLQRLQGEHRFLSVVVEERKAGDGLPIRIITRPSPGSLPCATGSARSASS
jgi:hypothetical protein